MDKKEFIEEVFKEFAEVYWALDFSKTKGTGSYTVFDAIDDLTEQGKKLLFSNIYGGLKTRGADLIKEDITIAMNIAKDYKKWFNFFDPDFKFHDDPYEFYLQFQSLLVIFYFNETDVDRGFKVIEGRWTLEVGQPGSGISSETVMVHGRPQAAMANG